MRKGSYISRVIILAICLILILTLFGIQLMQFQIIDGEKHLATVQGGWESEQTIKAARGEILDRYGRPMALNRYGIDIVIDKAFFPAETQNEVILRLIELMESTGTGWIDSLPITETVPFNFKPGYTTEVENLKINLELRPFATIDDALHWMKERYDLQGYPDGDMRKLAGVRYEMEQRGFTISTPYTFSSDVSFDVVSKIKERSFELPGVTIVENPIRQYVSADVAPHIIGQIGPIFKNEYPAYKEKGYQMNSIVGKTGIESAFEEQLRGVDGTRQISFSKGGEVLNVEEKQPAIPGNSIVLTLDKNMQRITQDSLERQIKWLQTNAPEGKGKEADAGAAVAINVKTGEILAAATYPYYNLEDFNYGQLITDPLKPLFDRALKGQYTPGSTFKPVVATAGLNEEIVTHDSRINCGGVYTFFPDPNFRPRCLRADGMIDIVNALRMSCNIYFYDVGRQIGISEVVKYASSYGFGQPTGIELSEEIGRVSSPETSKKLGREWYVGDVVQASIGQLDTMVTPLQLANYTAAIASRGDRKKATIVKSINSYNFDTVIKETTPITLEKIEADGETFDSIFEGMVAASRTGTAVASFGNYPINVASKTGTPETVNLPNSTFIAFAPAEDPQIAVAVVIEKGWHGYTGAPVAKDIFNQYFFSDTQTVQTERYMEILK